MQPIIARRWAGAAAAALSLVAALLSAAPQASATTAFCSLTGLDNFYWDNEAHNGLWQDPVNWNHNGNANDIAPGTLGDTPYDDYACIPAGDIVQLDTGGQGISADLAALDLGANAVLTVGRGGFLLLDGGPSGTARSVTRAGSTLGVVGSTLGGAATLTVQGTLNWTSVADGAATQTTRRCDESEPPTCPGPTSSPGRTLIAAGGQMLIGGFGVNLEDSRIIENHGTTVLSGNGYLAADYGTSFVNDGQFVIQNGLGIFQGRRHYNLPQRSTFIDNGTLRKAAAGTSIIDAAFTRPTGGNIEVTAGFLSIYGNLNGSSTIASATVKQGATFGTGACPPGASSCAQPTPSNTDRQTTQVSLPALGTGSATVSMQELPGEKTAAMRTAPVEVKTPGASADPTHPMLYVFALDSTLRRAGETAHGLAQTLQVARRGDTDPAYATVPNCGSTGPTAAHPSCVDRAASVSRTDKLANGDVLLVVRTLQNSRWRVS